MWQSRYVDLWPILMALANALLPFLSPCSRSEVSTSEMNTQLPAPPPHRQRVDSARRISPARRPSSIYRQEEIPPAAQSQSQILSVSYSKYVELNIRNFAGLDMSRRSIDPGGDKGQVRVWGERSQ